jgi:hypothetical protein
LNGDGAECACDDVVAPAITNGKESIAIKVSPTPGAQNIKISPTPGSQNIKTGFSCRYMGETQDCHSWCSETCSGPCSVCLNADGADCACDEIPALNDKFAAKVQPTPGSQNKHSKKH